MVFGVALLALLLQTVTRLHGQGTGPSEASVLDRARWVHPHLVANDLLDVGYFGQMGEQDLNYVAVGRQGVILTSPDAVCWTYAYSRGDLFNITAGNIQIPNGPLLKYYAGSREGALAIYDSSNRGWGTITPTGAPTYNNAAGKVVPIDFLGAAYGGDRLVLVGNEGYAGMTQNGVDWWWSRALPSGITNDLVSLAYRSGQFVAASTTNLVVTSRDGTNWVFRRIEVPLKRIRVSPSGFIGLSTDERIGLSPDGETWSFVQEHGQGVSTCIAGFGTEIVLTGEKSLLSSSAALTSWRKIGSPLLVTNQNFNAITRSDVAGDPFVVVGDRGTILTYSAGATAAVNRNNDRVEDLTGVAYGEGKYAAVGRRGVVWSRTDGTNGALWGYLSDTGAWDPRGSGTTNDLAGVAFGKGRFVAVGGAFAGSTSHATIITSRDTTNWSPVVRLTALTDPATGAKAYPAGIAFGDGRFVVLAQGELGAAMVSVDGNRWDTSFSSVLNGMRGIGYGNGMFVAVGTNIATSVDGFTWTLDTTVSNANLYAVSGMNGTFVAVGGAPTALLVKTNGAAGWAVSKARVTAPLFSVNTGASQFFACGTNGLSYNSRDGLNWDSHTSFGAKFNQRSIIVGNNEIAMVGDRGDITVTPKIDTVVGRPAPLYNVATGGGTGLDRLESIAYTGTSQSQFYAVGSTFESSVFGNQTLGDPTAALSLVPKLLLLRHSDTGSVTFAATGPDNSRGTHLAVAGRTIMVGGVALDSQFPANTYITASGVGFIAQAVPQSSTTPSNCFQKVLLTREDSLSSDFNWARHFDGTLSDLKLVQLASGAEVRFAGTFGAAVEMGDDINIESTNTTRSFFLTKCDAGSGTNTWVRWLEPTNQLPVEQIYGLKLAADAKGTTFAFGAVSGGLNIYSNVPPPPPDPGTGGGGFASRRGRPLPADACPPGHSASSSALDGSPCTEACPPGHSPTMSTLQGAPCDDGTGSTNEVPKFAIQGTLSVTNHTPGLSMFLSVFDPTGALKWANWVGPAGAVPVAAATDAEGTAYVAGNLEFGTIFVGAYKFSTNGVSNVWMRVLTPGGGAHVTAFDVRTNGLSVLAGTFQTQTTFAEAKTFGRTNLISGGTASFVLRIKKDGLLLSAQAEGTAEEQTGFSTINALYPFEDNRLALAGFFVQRAKFGNLTATSRGLGDTYLAIVESIDPPPPPPLEPPTLKISRVNKSVRLEWPEPFILQKSASANPAAWADLAVPSPLDLSPTQSAQYYRLRSP